MERYLIIAGICLLAFMVPILFRVIVGPTAIDRIVAANIIGTKAAVLLVIIGTIFERVEMFVDFALAYALLNFMGSLAVAKYFHRTRPGADRLLLNSWKTSSSSEPAAQDGPRPFTQPAPT